MRSTNTYDDHWIAASNVLPILASTLPLISGQFVVGTKEETLSQRSDETINSNIE